MTARLPASPPLQLFGLLLAAVALGLLAGYDPKLALAVALGCAFVLIAFADLAAGVAIFGFLTFVELTSEGSVLSATKLAGLLLALSWLGLVAIRTSAHGTFVLEHKRTSGILLAFLGWSLLSASWAEDPGVAVLETSRYALNVMLFVIVFTAVTSSRDVRLVVAAFVAGACAAAVYGYVTPPISDFEGRLSTAVLDPNQLAGVLVPGALLAFGLAISLKRYPAGRIVALAAGIFCTFSVLMTVSRGGLIALSVALLATIVLGGRWRATIAVATAMVAVGGFLYFTTIAPDDARERITQTTQGQSKVREGRATIWQVGWRAVQDQPVHGLGAGNFQVSSRRYLFEPGVLGRTDQVLDKPEVAHNTYLQVLSELGIVGLIAFLALIAISIVTALRAAITFRAGGDGGMAALSIAFTVGLIGTLAADFFISEHLSNQLWLLLGLGPALLTVARSETAGGPA